MGAAGFGLASALTYGVGDFLGGLASRHDSPTRVVALTHPVAILAFTLLAALTGEALPPARDLAWGLAAGLVGLVAVLAFYRALALGPMGTVSVTAGALSALVPVVVGVASGEVLTPLAAGGALLILAGTGLLSATPGTGGRGGVLLGVLAGLGFGLFFVMLAQAKGGVYWPLAAARLASSAVIVPLVTLREGLRPQRPALVLAALPGDALGNFFYLLSAQAGKLSIAGLLTSLYPAFTTLLAVVVLREHLRPTQWAGVALAFAGALLVTR
ncbi:DMT family transporter [Deinococcus maricopensis]|uniref:EamA domain-containing protein n=1 Tax=Deinococcus maricopensis (strain DSM 21211 / LMG 22137 / NRRL B-23946 / LB-34) TaxID=709986 RepID=E8UAS0_DEIML|nr:DMT family transporter [Deinococcus maricopensis]ADV68159.1 protein of unknown function DUF6 transmembrane [Deinococcus maricopensis DSM 21211]